ncbi:MAG: hypothetical protein ACOYS2_02415 [Patescibacteria group bacterium]
MDVRVYIRGDGIGIQVLADLFDLELEKAKVLAKEARHALIAEVGALPLEDQEKVVQELVYDGVLTAKEGVAILMEVDESGI